MIYTLGHTESYREYLADRAGVGGVARKIGPRDYMESFDGPYRGGIAFETVEDAIAWRDNNDPTWSPFVLDGDWTTDVRWDDECQHYRITRDLTILGEPS